MIRKIRIYSLFFSIRVKRGFSHGFKKGLGYLFQAILVLFLKEKKKIFYYLYAWFRRIDDIMDGESVLPFDYSLNQYLSQKKESLMEIGQ